jgi:hypothetical protein
MQNREAVFRLNRSFIVCSNDLSTLPGHEKLLEAIRVCRLEGSAPLTVDRSMLPRF